MLMHLIGQPLRSEHRRLNHRKGRVEVGLCGQIFLTGAWSQWPGRLPRRQTMRYLTIRAEPSHHVACR
jgi:hypothetical protein